MLAWKRVRLGDHCSTFSGGTPSVSNSAFYGGKIPFIKSGEIYQDFTEVNISEQGFENSASKMVKKGDLLYAIYGTGTVGNVAISQIDGAINQAVLCIRSKTLNTVFLCYLLAHLKKRILDTYIQGGQGNLSAKLIQNLQIIIPPLKEQEKIASILSSQDALIISLKKLEDKKSKIKLALMSKLLKPQANWQSKSLGEVCKKAQSGGTPLSTNPNFYNGSIPFVKIDDITASGKYLSDTKVKITQEGLESSAAWLVPKNSILYSMYASVGFLSINTVEVATNQGIINLIPDESKINLDFLYYILVAIQKDMDKYTDQTTQKNLNATKVRNLEIIIPPLNSQIQIANILSLADRELGCIKALIKKEENIKKALAKKLLSGEIKL